MTDIFQENPLVIRHEANQTGRDFVVGDLHGCRSMLDDLLAKVSFDGTRDRLFSVGDLVDRGPDSQGCLALLLEPWFFAVLGNHEAMLSAYWFQEPCKRKYLYGTAHVYAKPNWTSESQELQKTYRPILQRLPFVRVIGSGDSRFQVLHAERVNNENQNFLSDADLDAAQPEILTMRHPIVGFDGSGDWFDHLLWGRSRVYSDSPLAFKKIQTRDFCGHTPTLDPRHPHSVVQLGQQVYLDTGAFAAKGDTPVGLTLWNVTEDHGWRMLGNGQAVRCDRFVVGGQRKSRRVRHHS